MERSIKTRRDSPRLASQAPKVRIIKEKNCSACRKDEMVIKRVRERTMASKERSAIRRCFCCIQKQRRPLLVAMRREVCERDAISYGDLIFPLVYKTSARSMSFSSNQLTEMPNFNSQS